ncbi:ABC-type multidrug transport system, ATPase and permease component [Streptoalloteichus tenebrarius]|uniref:ABC-type multidrug transport system, ATPase and permease component n=1 Tax=Streptoalloteichus tenebrarius (strain ATCC 17920 / DSM 40477 / JCM 4838 / CBS 697.72 / NBRC 16177 / NCIMB 11028 / NRRL B-12390 / A12253. 1 / ISP 5477) TaxID=1933 RepID=Q2MFL1_STRSD|nr:ABC transporter ATP-binding protein [Streptoalloteichus tenebrarius]MCP2262623.1 ABC-type multidrug transport system, ATPase and permease component [Streptoalloteichus tenebrarius]BFF00868.1 ABC transporter ATP-binding protein [Streptoalloteichus tenebrarius]CAF33030.1 putative ABC-type aminoglycoside exporter [Streptoalloteichus tenebrarius]
MNQPQTWTEQERTGQREAGERPDGSATARPTGAGDGEETAQATGQPPAQATGQEWRGVAAEDHETVDRRVGRQLQRRSRRLLLDLLRPHRLGAVVALLLAVLDTAAEMARPLLIAAVIDTGIPAAAGGDHGPLAWAVAGYLLSSAASAGLTYSFMALSGRIGQDVLLELRQRLFHQVQRLSLSFHESYTSGKVISRLTSDLQALSTLLEESIEGLFRAFLSVVSIAVLLVWLDLPLTGVILATFVPLLWITWRYRRRSHFFYRRTRTTIARVIGHFVETMNGIRVVQAYRLERSNSRRMDELNAAHQEATVRAGYGLADSTAGINLIGNTTIALVLLVGGWRIIHGELEVGVLAAYVLYLGKFYDPIDDLARFANSYASANAALEKISGVLEERPTVAQPADPVPLRVRSAAIDFHHVDFRYQPDKALVLRDVDLHIPAGQTVAVVGETGAGKSTIAKLLARFYDPTSGRVTVNGIDLRDVADADLRATTAMITQESFLFSGTIADNIALGRPEATREEIVRAATAIGAHEFITRLPDGYDTDVNKRGTRLSAGQRQLVALARALLADAAVLILDEATSSMDIATERAVQRALRTTLRGRTALIIAHRLSTVLAADRVLVVERGRIVEDGPPAALVEGGGRFATLHDAWLASTSASA